jgi:hypothetical protein
MDKMEILKGILKLILCESVDWYHLKYGVFALCP